MFTKHRQAFLLGLALVLLAGLSGCGWQSASSQGGASNAPDRVQIAIYLLDPQLGKPVVTLTHVSLVRQLYTTVVGLSLLPQNSACTADLGPSYTLTFLQGGKTLTTATAQHYGCGVVSITGEKQDRQANQGFWPLLDQAISQALPVASPKQLALLRTLRPDQPPQTAQIMSVETAQHLYQAILALPQTSQNGSCSSPESFHQYQLVFHTADQAIPSVIDQHCNTISLEGTYQSRGGTFVMNDQFKQLFEQTLAAAHFAPARPDRLTLNLQLGSVAGQSTITNPALRQQLYTKIFALPTGKAPPNCPSGEDKIAEKGKWYMFSFMQWDLPILVNVDAYEGSCRLVSLDANQGTGAG